MNKLKAKDVSAFNLVDATQVKEAWLLHRSYINDFLKSQFIFSNSEQIVSLTTNGFSSFNKYLLHPSIFCSTHERSWNIFLVKAAMFEVYENTEGPNLSHFIYQRDKECNRKPRGIPDTLYDRLDQFKCGLEAGNIIRHFGTQVGAEAYAKEPKNRTRSLKNGLKRRSDYRAVNKEFLRGLTYGFSHENENRTLVCPMDGSKIEGIATYCENSKELVYSDCYEIHHAKYDQIGSFYKSSSPSGYLNTEDFSNFTQDVIEEFLGCIILSQSSHTRVHHTHKIDGIDNWLSRINAGRCIFIPYHWRSENAYINTLTALEEKCKNFSATSALSYVKFIERHNSVRHRTTDEIQELPKRKN